MVELFKNYSANVVGTTFRNVGNVLMYLRHRVSDRDIILYAVREKDNAFDRNAIKIIVTVKGSNKKYHIGYFSKDIAKVLAPMLDTGRYDISFENIHTVGGDIGRENVGIYFSFSIYPKVCFNKK